MITVSNIEWDADGFETMLPTTVTLHFPCKNDETEIAEALSNLFGFCVNSFVIERS